MKKTFEIILFLLLIVAFSGCEKKKENNLQIYLEKLQVQNEASYDFYVPRILNGEGDHIITWESSNTKILEIGNIISITGLQYYVVEVNKLEESIDVKLTANIEMKNGDVGKKTFIVKILEDASIKEEKIKYINEIISEFENLEVKESIKLPRVTEKYGFELIWKSNNEDVISSSGEYKSPQEDVNILFDVSVLYNGVLFYKKTITMIAINKNSVEKEVLLDFVGKFSNFAQSWDSSYVERKVDNIMLDTDIEVDVVFSRADKQASTITDRPVVATKGSTEYITVFLKEETFKNIEFSLTQWSTKTFDKIYLEYYDGTSWIKCSEEMTIPQLIKTEILIPNIKMIRLSFYSQTNKNVQMGLEWIKFELN